MCATHSIGYLALVSVYVLQIQSTGSRRAYRRRGRLNEGKRLSTTAVRYSERPEDGGATPAVCNWPKKHKSHMHLSQVLQLLWPKLIREVLFIALMVNKLTITFRGWFLSFGILNRREPLLSFPCSSNLKSYSTLYSLLVMLFVKTICATPKVIRHNTIINMLPMLRWNSGSHKYEHTWHFFNQQCKRGYCGPIV